ncbi:MAG: glycoside hydrolase family 5 protein [Pseudomonadota bacterium]
MTRWISFAVALAAFLTAASCGSEASPQQQTAAPLTEVPAGPIQRCVNLSNGLEAPREGEWGYVVRARHILAIAETGFDTVRLPVKVSAYTGPAPDFAISEQLLSRLDTLIGQAVAADLNIILDVHHFDEIYADPDGELPRLKAIWRQLGARYAGAPDSLIFEVLNEPRDALTVSRMNALNREMLAVIRETNPTRWVILSSAEWGGLSGWLEADFPRELNVMSTFHYYEPYEFTHQGATWMDTPPEYSGKWGDDPSEIAAVREHFARARQKALSDGLPVLLGEFGAHRSNSSEERAIWLETVRRASEQAGFGWCHWGLASEFGLYDAEAKTWTPEMLEALGLSPERPAP